MLREVHFASTLCISHKDMDALMKGIENKTVAVIGRLAAGGYDLTRTVQHLILVGNYDCRAENLNQPTGKKDPYQLSTFANIFLFCMDLSGQSGDDWGDWKQLKTITIRNACVDAEWLNVNKFGYPHCHRIVDKTKGAIVKFPGQLVVRRLILSNVTLFYTVWGVSVEFYIETLSTDLSGDFGCLGCSLKCCDTSACNEPAAPAELTKLCAEQAVHITPEEVLALKPIYETFLKGREGCVIRDGAIMLLERLDTNRRFRNLDLKGTRYMKDTFARANVFFYYCLLYYSKPRNFFRVASAEELASMRDEKGNPLRTKFEIDLYKEWEDDDRFDNYNDKCVLC